MKVKGQMETFDNSTYGDCQSEIILAFSYKQAWNLIIPREPTQEQNLLGIVGHMGHQI